MMSSGRRLLLVLIMLWLPLQGAMAASMSLCTKEQDSSKLETSVPISAGTLPCALEKDSSARSDRSDVPAADHIENQHHNGNHEQAMQGVTDEVTSNLQCNEGPCHASCGAPIPSVASGASFIDSSAYTLSFIPRFTSLVPEQLQRPPLV